jgi:hypothetical protein
MHELFVLYAPMLRDQGRRMGLPVGERDQLVDTLLDDIVMRLVEIEIPPRELTSYIVTALRNRVRTGHRDAKRGRESDEIARSKTADIESRQLGRVFRRSRGNGLKWCA